MANVPANLKYSNDHEWCRLEGEFAYVGITDFAQSELGDIVFVDIPTEGETLAAGDVFGTIEAVKTVSDAFLPVSGEVVEVNAAIDEDPALVNKDPYGEGWMIKVRVSAPEEFDALLSAEAYEALIEKQSKAFINLIKHIKTMSKVTVVGAGMVGATCANVLACRGVASEVVLVDIKEGLSEGKMLDMFQAQSTKGYKTKLVGVTATDAEGYKPTANSDVVVITSGIPRKPGMTREELIGINAKIVKGVVENALRWSPKAMFVIISNPMDTMTYLTLKATGLKKNRVIGMGGALDSSRFRCYLSKASGAGIQDIDGMVIGGHGDTTMIPLVSKASIKGVPVTKLLSKKKLEQVAADTMVGGATLTKLLGTSAWYAPGASAAVLVKAIVMDEKKVYPCCVALDGEYGQEDICIGVPALIGKKGCEKVVKYKLNAEEMALFEKSADATRKTNNILYEMNILQK